jgi:4-amino-4-deoxy-L-arabinose transferase-like glycosyltransferase
VLIALLALVPRLLGLGVFLTADEAKAWLGRAMMFGRALAMRDWAGTFDSPAPGVTTMWTGAIGLWLEYVREGRVGGTYLAFLDQMSFDPLDPMILPTLRLPGVVVSAVLAVLIYLWCRRLWGHLAGILAAAFFALDPFYLALTRILGHDGLVSGFMGAALIALLAALFGGNHPVASTSHRPLLAVSGVLGGLAFITKYPSLFLGAFVAVTLIVTYGLKRSAVGWTWRQTLTRWLMDVLIWSLAAGLIGFLLWPALWVDLAGTVSAILNDAVRASASSHPKGSFYLGQPMPDPGAGFYPLVTLYRITPVVGLGVMLAIASLWGIWRGKEAAFLRAILILILYVLLFGVLITLGGKKQDRYILPAFPALAALAGVGWSRLIGMVRASRGRLQKGGGLGLVGLLILAQMAFVLPHHPYYFTYYNPLLGGGPAAVDKIMVGWGEGLDQAARWLNTRPNAQELDVVAWYSTTFEPFFKGHAIYEIEEEKISRASKPGLAADYVVLYVNQVQRELPSPGALQFFRATPAVYTVTLHGIDYAWIHPSLSVQHVVSDDVRLVGQAELLGYSLTDEGGRPITEVHADSVVFLSLYWEWQGKAKDEPIGVSLVDDQGVTRGWGNPIRTEAPLAYDEWQEGMIVRDDFAMVIFSDTLPGAYRLSAWIDRPATGETVGVFPLGNQVMIRVVGGGK